MHEVFEKYIPKFEYELVDLNDYSIEALTEYGDLLSLFMILDKIKSPEELGSVLSSIPGDYVERLKSNVPAHLRKLLADVVQVLLTKIDVPQEEIDEVAEGIYERGVPEMFNIENYSVQETRRKAREEGIKKGKREGKREGKKEGKKEGKREGIDLLAKLLEEGLTLEEALEKAKCETTLE